MGLGRRVSLAVSRRVIGVSKLFVCFRGKEVEAQDQKAMISRECVVQRNLHDSQRAVVGRSSAGGRALRAESRGDGGVCVCVPVSKLVAPCQTRYLLRLLHLFG